MHVFKAFSGYAEIQISVWFDARIRINLMLKIYQS